MRSESVILTLLLLVTIASTLDVTREVESRLKRLEENWENTDYYHGSPREDIGAVYTRWGRTTCGKDNELFYTGYTGGSHYTHRGAAVNHLCLPKVPQWHRYTSNADGNNNYVYGTEYETNTKFEPFKKNHDYNVPCAVCRTRRSSIYMIPAKTKCPKGWHVEYSGYLMAGYYGHYATEFVCVDQNPEPISGTSRNEDGALLYMVEAKCDSLPCETYKTGRELACVVCSK